MKQTINLLSALPAEEVRHIHFKQITMFCMILFILLCGYTGVTYHTRRAFKEEVAQLEMFKAISVGNLDVLKEEHPELVSGETMTKQLEAIKRFIETKKRIISILTSRKSILNIGGFSAYFKLFSEVTTPSIWLTKVHIGNGGADIVLQGEALNSQDVLAMVEAINQNELFNKTALTLSHLIQPTETHTSFQFTLIAKGQGGR